MELRTDQNGIGDNDMSGFRAVCFITTSLQKGQIFSAPDQCGFFVYQEIAKLPTNLGAESNKFLFNMKNQEKPPNNVFV